MPTISRYMTRQPWTIRSDAALAQAKAMMHEHKVRHLPVLEGGKLVGIVTERDVYLLGRFENGFTVEDAMTADVYAVGPDDPVADVVEQMADRRLGSAIVLNLRGAVEGIFTTVDGMAVLADVLRRATA